MPPASAETLDASASPMQAPNFSIFGTNGLFVLQVPLAVIVDREFTGTRSQAEHDLLIRSLIYQRSGCDGGGRHFPTGLFRSVGGPRVERDEMFAVCVCVLQVLVVVMRQGFLCRKELCWHIFHIFFSTTCHVSSRLAGGEPRHQDKERLPRIPYILLRSHPLMHSHPSHGAHVDLGTGDEYTDIMPHH